ncbi:S49 family peptidase [Beggiatoa alba]|nr:S49 family peptidase [Beggiatoa alba]
MADHDKPENAIKPEASPDKNETGRAAQNNDKKLREENDVWTSNKEVEESDTEKSAITTQQSKSKEGDWEKDTLNRLAFAAINEQRRARRWSVFFKSLFFIYLFVIFFYIPGDWNKPSMKTDMHTALIDLEGVIAANTQASADNLVGALRAAFKDKKTTAVLMRINSPGGSPVQAGYVYDEIKRLRQKYPDIKLYAVIADICASGGYYIAAAADEIYADKASIVGSIGVLMDGFGFVDTIKTLGIERRLMTAGKHKGVLDPFSPLKKSEVKHVQNLLDTVHKQFIDQVKAGRGDRLSDSPDLFTGLFWNGEESVKLGLVDGLGSASYVAREIIGEENIVDFTPRPNFLNRFADRIGVTMASVLSKTVGLEGATSPLR